MARYDKYNGMTGGFRAKLYADIDPDTEVAVPLAVGLDANGLVVLGEGNTGVIGVLVVDSAKYAGDVVDVMTAGEIVEVADLDAGTQYYGDGSDGSITDTKADDTVFLGHTVEATRMVVRVHTAVPAGA